MMRFWVDIENAFGAKVGEGPLTSVLTWQHTANLDRAGAFAFTLPADDPRAALIVAKRIARCWTVEGGRLRHLGAGIIHEARQTFDAENRPLLTVSGDDLLTELLYRIIPLDTLNETTDVHPARAGYQLVSSGVTYSQASWIDLGPGDTTTWANNPGNAVHIYSPHKFNRVNFVLHASSQNGLRHGGIAEYWDGSGWVEFALKENTTVVDGDWFGRSGYMTWEEGAVAWPEGREPNYEIRFRATTLGWLDFAIADITLRVTGPTSQALAKIMGYAPAGWQLDAGNGYTTTDARPLVGAELLLNGGFEAYTGTANDATSDTWTGWQTVETPEHFAYVQAVTTAKHGGAAAVKLTTGSTYGSAYLTQTTAVEPGTEYTLRYWTRGDGGSGQISVALHDADHAGQYGGRFFYADSLVTGSAWTERRVTFTTPAGCNNLTLYVWNPSALNSYALVDDVSLLAGGGDAIALEAAGETVLESLIRVTETTGEHFCGSPNGRMVLWLRHDARPSGVRCVAGVDAVAAEGHADIAIIQSLTEIQTTTNLISRVYPYGGGREPIPTLRNTTRQAPPGYTLDKAANCLIRDQAEAAYGRVERRLDAPDVTNVTGDPSGDVHSCNMLFDRAYTLLRRNSATNLALVDGDAPRTYQITLLKCDQALLPGYTVRVTYDRYVEAQRRLHVDADLWIISATTQVDESGIRTVALECATVDAALLTDEMLLADMLRRQRAMQAHGASG